jgi:hypothetical protein
MIEVRVTDQKNSDLAEVKPEGFNVFPDQRHILRKGAVDQDEPLWRGDQKRCQVLASNVVYVPDDAIRGLRSGPVRVVLREQATGEDKNTEKGTKEHGKE